MKLVIKKAKRATVASYVSGASVLVLIFSLGYYVYLPISKLVATGKFVSFRELFPFNDLFRPFLGFFLSAILLWLSNRLKDEGSLFAKWYERLSAGVLLSIFLIMFWIIAFVFDVAMELLF